MLARSSSLLDGAFAGDSGSAGCSATVCGCCGFGCACDDGSDPDRREGFGLGFGARFAFGFGAGVDLGRAVPLDFSRVARFDFGCAEFFLAMTRLY